MSLEDHFYSLAEQHDVKVLPYFSGLIPGPTSALQSASDRKARTVYVASLKRLDGYIVALHELGHVLGPWQSEGLLKKEAGAWKWARAHAIRWGAQGDLTMARGMLSYLTCAIETQGTRRPLQIPPKGHYFWKCLPQVKSVTWLSEKLFVPPWTKIMAEPARPKCAFCANWTAKRNDEHVGVCQLPEVIRVMPAQGYCPSYRI